MWAGVIPGAANGGLSSAIMSRPGLILPSTSALLSAITPLSGRAWWPGGISCPIQSCFKGWSMKQAVILAAGEGQRLRPFTVNRPKTMITIADKPILQFVIESLAQNGIRDIILVVGYRKEQVYDYMGSGDEFGVNITYVTQAQQLGTAHALSLVRYAVGDEFLVLPGDNLIEAHTIADFSGIAPDAVLVKRVSNPER